MNRRTVPLLAVLAVAVATMGCPHIEPISGCQPRSYRCAPNPPGEAAGTHPESCTNNQRWSRIGDVGCEAIPPGTARCVVVEGLAYCANPDAPAAPLAPRSAVEPPPAAGASLPATLRATLGPMAEQVTGAVRAARRIARF